MEMEFTEEQALLQQTARKFFEDQLPLGLVKELQQPGASGHSADVWNKMAAMGWHSVAIPEAYGGMGGSLFDLGIIYEEAGRALLPTTFYSTMYAALVIGSLGTEEQKRTYLSRIAEGQMISTAAYAEPDALHNADCFKTTARKVHDRWVLNGTKAFVPNAQLAEAMVVIARTEDDERNEGLTAFLVPAGADGVSQRPMKTFGKDPQSEVTFVNVELSESGVLGGPEGTEKAALGLAQAMKQATALQCMEMAGGARKVLEMTVSYVSGRKQFGVPIGSFQAVQHHLANMATQVDGAQLAAYQAVSLLSEGLEADRETAIAKAYTSEAYKSATVMAHQLWGGMGYATESDLYLFSNRAKAAELSFGTRDYHLKQLANLLALAAY